MHVSEFLSLVRGRSSCRSYLDKDVSDEAIGLCLEAACLAPSACNKQPWRFIIVKDKATRLKVCEDCLLPAIPMPWLKTAPVLVVLCAEKNFLTHKAAPLFSGIPYHYIDCGIAGEHFVLAAEAQGLGTCWIGWLNTKRLRKLLSIPSNLDIVSMISLGHPAARGEQPQKKSIAEISRRIGD